MTRIGKSEAQANAEALANRGRTYAAPNDRSVKVAWDFRKRQPRDLRDAEAMVRRLYEDEVPTRLHEHAVGDDGTPRMAAKAEAYIFGGDSWTDAGPTDEPPLVSYYRTPFRHNLSMLEGRSPERAAIVRHTTIGGMTAKEAAIKEGVPGWCAAIVAEDVLRAFLRSMTDLKIHLPKEVAAA